MKQKIKIFTLISICFICLFSLRAVHAKPSYKSDNCFECKGSGKCYKCHGTGKQKCLTCFGTGTVLSTSSDENGRAVVSRVSCTTCDGSGKIDCDNCNGSGTCPICNGTGKK